MYNLITSVAFILFALIIVAQIGGDFALGTRGDATRIRRQSDCFKCKKSNECIDRDKECDGIVDCKDGSDESNSCHRIKCPTFLYRCKYGACINPDLACDGKKDCRDGSDEDPARCRNDSTQAGCNPSTEYQCISGQCIFADNRCDGVADCTDGSDETTELCSKIQCPGFTYRCAYGACVNGNSRCNGVKECHDGSDEQGCATPAPTLPPEIVTVSPPSPKPDTPAGYCLLPEHPENGKWIILGTKTAYKPGEEVEDSTTLKFACNPTFTAVGEKLIYCERGSWSNSIPQCAKLCPAFVSTKTTKVTCTYRQIPANCSEARSGTVARFECAPYYEDLQLKRIPQRICHDGSWDLEKPNCVPACGQKSVKATALIINGTNATKGDYPWQVALYSVSGAGKSFICGGSLINQRVVLSAAHCVCDLKGNVYPKTSFMAAVGKYYQKFDDLRDKDAQHSAIKEIYVAEQYRGDSQNYIGDIAILVTEKIFKLSKYVAPVCVDWGQNYESQLTEAGTPGIVTGWGLTQTNGNVSDALKELSVPYIPFAQCQQELPTDYDVYLSYDKFCSGFLNQSSGVCSGDSGGGLVARNRYDGRYYITGIVSISPQAEGSCDVNEYALYTKVSTYYAFLFEKERLFRPRID